MTQTKCQIGKMPCCTLPGRIYKHSGRVALTVMTLGIAWLIGQSLRLNEAYHKEKENIKVEVVQRVVEKIVKQSAKPLPQAVQRPKVINKQKEIKAGRVDYCKAYGIPQTPCYYKTKEEAQAYLRAYEETRRKINQ